MDPEDIMILPFREYIRIHGRDNAVSRISEYRCIRDSATEAFLHEKAIEMESRNLSRTYLAILPDNGKVIGYITLSIKCMTVPKENLLSGKVLRNMNIESRTGIAQSYLLGQPSRSSDAPKGLGTLLLAFDRLSVAKDAVGCKMVRLDCHDELIPYYTDHGFKLIRKNDDGTLNQMMAFIPDRGSSGPDL